MDETCLTCGTLESCLSRNVEVRTSNVFQTNVVMVEDDPQASFKSSVIPQKLFDFSNFIPPRKVKQRLLPSKLLKEEEQVWRKKGGMLLLIC